MASKGYLFDENDRREFLRMKRKLDSIRGPGVVNSPDAIFIGPPSGKFTRAFQAGALGYQAFTSSNGTGHVHRGAWR